MKEQLEELIAKKDKELNELNKKIKELQQELILLLEINKKLEGK